MRLDEQFLKKAIPDASIICGTFPSEPHFSIDSRTLKKGDIFVALQGTQCNGHEFLQEVLAKDAAGIVIELRKKDLLRKIKKDLLNNKLVLVVPDTFAFLCNLAKAWREQFSYPVVAITGSVGKTSTKEIIRTVVGLHSDKFFVAHGNQNTQLGLALNMLCMHEIHEAAIFEVGISKRGEMADRAAMLKPTTAVITSVGHSHMSGLGSVLDIAVEKRDIFKNFTESNIGIINGDVPILAQVSYLHPVIKFGSKTSNQIQIRKVRIGKNQTRFILKIYKNKHTILFSHTHLGMVYNAAAAVAVCYLLNIPIDTIIKGIQMPLSIEGRFEQCFLPAGKSIIINDCYNANPESTKTSLLAFHRVDTKAQKILVLGDMLELGVNSPFWHRQLGRFLRKVPSLNYVILVGDLVKWTQKTLPLGLKSDLVPSWKETIELLKEKLSNESLVLVKGSHAMSLDNVVNFFSAERAKQAVK